MIGELNDEQVEHLLHSQVVGRIGCHTGGRTYVVPVTYVYHRGSIYGHTYEGLKVQMMRANPQVCFEVDRMENMANWQSVVAWGHFEELQGEQVTKAMQLLIDRLMPLITSETSTPSHSPGNASVTPIDITHRRAVVYRITLTEKTGRFEKR